MDPHATQKKEFDARAAKPAEHPEAFAAEKAVKVVEPLAQFAMRTQ